MFEVGQTAKRKSVSPVPEEGGFSECAQSSACQRAIRAQDLPRTAAVKGKSRASLLFSYFFGIGFYDGLRFGHFGKELAPHGFACFGHLGRQAVICG